MSPSPSKSPALYRAILGTWALLVLCAAPALIGEILRASAHIPLIQILIWLSTIGVLYFWLNGTKDIVYASHFHLNRAKWMSASTSQPSGNPPLARVLLVYCTCDDFDEASLAISMQQDYANSATVILDDSRDESYRWRVDAFARTHGVAVIRRPDRRGFKAGNLNNFLRAARFDYFVLLDSGEIIPANFVRLALSHFTEGVGIVQANHVATRSENRFMQRFSPGVNSHWPAYQSLKQRYGFLSLLGHGAMISRECYDAAGGFPEVVAEDLAFSIRARCRGFFTTFAADIVCEETYPVHYLAFRKRHAKWTQGNMEFIKKFTLEILSSRLRWFEKLDIFLFTYSLPLAIFFVGYLAINLVVLPLLGYHVEYPAWLLLPTLMFLVAPMLNDILEYGHWSQARRLASYCVHTMLLYGSMFYTTWAASLRSLFGSSTFIVTPKAGEHITLRRALVQSRQDLTCAATLLAISWLIDGSALPSLLLASAALATPYLTLLSNRPPAQDFNLVGRGARSELRMGTASARVPLPEEALLPATNVV